MTLKWYGDDVMKKIRNGVPDALFAAGEEFVEIAAARAPMGDGTLRESGYVASKDKSTYKRKYEHRKEVKPEEGAVVAGFAAFYAHMVEYGTKAHQIGRSGQPLRLVSGKVVRGPIQHPGTRPQPFFRPTLDEAKGQLGDIVASKMRQKLSK